MRDGGENQRRAEIRGPKTEVIPRFLLSLVIWNNRNEVAYILRFADRVSAAVGPFEPEGTGRTAVEVERALHFEIGLSQRAQDFAKTGQGRVRAITQRHAIVRRAGHECAPIRSGCFQSFYRF